MRTNKNYRIKGRMKRAVASWKAYDKDFHVYGRLRICINSFFDTPQCLCSMNICSIHEQ